MADQDFICKEVSLTNCVYCYQRAISCSPLKGWRKYLGLAQLLEGKDAVLQYTKGIEVMEREVAEKLKASTQNARNQASVAAPDEGSSQSQPPNDESVKGSSDFPQPRDISNAYLSISELYTTDLW